MAATTQFHVFLLNEQPDRQQFGYWQPEVASHSHLT
jgi:hypothetical protein